MLCALASTLSQEGLDGGKSDVTAVLHNDNRLPNTWEQVGEATISRSILCPGFCTRLALQFSCWTMDVQAIKRCHTLGKYCLNARSNILQMSIYSSSILIAFTIFELERPYPAIVQTTGSLFVRAQIPP